jgi:Lrp/AsnC family transcriptional regulator, leucine-responsive regulatory protein
MTTDSFVLDEKDRILLRALQRDGRITNSALAERAGLSESACLRRREALEKRGFVIGYRAQLSREALGFALDVFVAITLKDQAQATLTAFEAGVKLAPEVLECFLTTGESDYRLRICARDVADLERIHAQVLTRLPGVARIQSSVVMRTVVERETLPI